MHYFLLLVNNRNDSQPSVKVLPARNITLREDQARGIFNGSNVKHINKYGKFDPENDLLIPVDYSSEISGFLRAFCYDRENIEEEDDDSPIVNQFQDSHICVFDRLLSGYSTGTTATYKCRYRAEYSCPMQQVRRRDDTGEVLRTYNSITGEEVYNINDE